MITYTLCALLIPYQHVAIGIHSDSYLHGVCLYVNVNYEANFYSQGFVSPCIYFRVLKKVQDECTYVVFFCTVIPCFYLCMQTLRKNVFHDRINRVGIYVNHMTILLNNKLSLHKNVAYCIPYRLN